MTPPPFCKLYKKQASWYGTASLRMMRRKMKVWIGCTRDTHLPTWLADASTHSGEKQKFQTHSGKSRNTEWRKVETHSGEKQKFQTHSAEKTQTGATSEKSKTRNGTLLSVATFKTLCFDIRPPLELCWWVGRIGFIFFVMPTATLPTLCCHHDVGLS